jgi:hypothetical protein
MESVFQKTQKRTNINKNGGLRAFRREINALYEQKKQVINKLT